MTTKANRIERYYDSHLREDEELSQSIFHQVAIEYLILVLRWLFNGQRVGVTTNVNFYQTADPNEPGISPDVAVVDELEDYERAADEPNSYYVGQDGPPPRVVFEVSSKETWQLDLFDKPARYAQMGVAEYFAFDPHQPGFWTRELRRKGRLRGWRLGPAGQYVELAKDAAGRLWSEQLNSWLVVDEKFLRLYTLEGKLRQTEAEAERQRAEGERQRAEGERQRAEAERQRLAALLEKLRRAGIDPDQL